MQNVQPARGASMPHGLIKVGLRLNLRHWRLYVRTRNVRTYVDGLAVHRWLLGRKLEKTDAHQSNSQANTTDRPRSRSVLERSGALYWFGRLGT